MIVSRIDPDAQSTHAAAKGFRALCEGDTVLAREKYSEAGEILERGSKRDVPAADKHLLRFLAASQYYHGGEYQRAAKLVAKINRGHIRPGHRATFDQFRKDVEERADLGYPDRIRKAVFHCWATNQAEKAIKLLQDHPYVIERAALAWARADLCYQSRRWVPATLFYADAIRFSQGQPWFMFMRAAGVIRLWAMDDAVAARDYSAQLLKHHPTPLDIIAAASIRVLSVSGVDPVECAEVLSLINGCLADFENLPEVARNNRDLRSLMAHGCAVAVIASNRLGRRTEAIRWAEQGLAFAPDGPEADAFRSVLVDPEQWLGSQSEPFEILPRSLLERERAIRGEKAKEIELPRAA